MISLSRVGARLRRRTHQPQVLRSVIYLRYCAWREALLDTDLDNLADQEEWSSWKRRTRKMTQVLPDVERVATVTMPTVRMDG